MCRESLEGHVRAGCSATRGAVCRAITRAVFSLLASIDCGAGKPSAEIFDTASTSSTHGLNPAMSPGATLTLCFLSPRPSPRCGLARRAVAFDYSRLGESAQAPRLVL